MALSSWSATTIDRDQTSSLPSPPSPPPPLAQQQQQQQRGSSPLVFRVAVGSTNPVKVNAVQQALELVLQQSASRRTEKVHLQVEGFEVASGVPDQPFGDEETQLGAKNRAKAAYDAYRDADPKGMRPHLAIGLEGGLEWSPSTTGSLDDTGSRTLWCMAWMAIVGERSNILAEFLASSDSEFVDAVDLKPIYGFAKTATFLLPTAIAKLIQQGMELGHADDKVFRRVNSKQQSGTVGVLTAGIIDRTEYYKPALVLALIPWIRPDVYSTPQTTT